MPLIDVYTLLTYRFRALDAMTARPVAGKSGRTSLNSTGSSSKTQWHSCMTICKSSRSFYAPRNSTSAVTLPSCCRWLSEATCSMYSILVLFQATASGFKPRKRVVSDSYKALATSVFLSLIKTTSVMVLACISEPCMNPMRSRGSPVRS